MAILIDDVQGFIFRGFSDFVFNTIGVRPYLATSNFIPVTSSYITINVLTVQPMSWCATAISAPDNQGRTDSYSQYLATIDLKVIGVDAFTVCQSLVDALKDPTLRQTLSNKGLGYSSASQVNNISVPVNNERIETRANATVNLYFVQGGNNRNSSGIIEKVNIDSSYVYSPGGQPI